MKTNGKPQGRGAPIFLQLLALAVVCMIAVQVVNVLGVLFLPDPPPQGFSLAEAARALKGETVITRSGRKLIAHVEPQAPQFPQAGPNDPMNPAIAGALASMLGVDPSKVRVAVQPDPGFIHAIHVSTTRDQVAKHMSEHTQLVIRMTESDHTLFPPDMIAHHLSGMMANAAVFPAFAAAYQRPDGRWSVVAPPRPWLSPWQVRMIATFLGGALVATLIAWFAAQRLARPIHAFALGAERLGGDPHAPPLTPQGPAEVRTAVGAFNDMQEKLKRYVADRTLMIASIAHDLRTPLMRLRFRVEGAPADVRDKTAADITEMDAMISAALAYARGEAEVVERKPLDLTALAAAVVADLSETGANVTFEPGAQILVLGDSVGLRRLLTNLIDNAVKFGGGAALSLGRDDAFAVARVEDRGPGLPQSELERVFEPFYRPDAARSAATGGFGLGLSAARSIARAHGGEITLSNRPGGGLAATTWLPI
jgi:signal transduction histidine kinase